MSQFNVPLEDISRSRNSADRGVFRFCAHGPNLNANKYFSEADYET